MIGRGVPPPSGAGRALDRWRLFIAVPLPRPILDELVARTAGLRARRESARWQSPETWHLTLRFLGDTPPSDVPAIVAGMEAAAAGSTPFDVELNGSGSFGGGRRGMVLWVGVSAGAVELGRLAALLAGELAAPSDPPEPRFRAHLTLAREAEPGLPDLLRAALAPGPPLRWRADRLVLYRSFLGPRGARHEEVRIVVLGGSSRDGTIVRAG